VDFDSRSEIKKRGNPIEDSAQRSLRGGGLKGPDQGGHPIYKHHPHGLKENPSRIVPLASSTDRRRNRQGSGLTKRSGTRGFTMVDDERKKGAVITGCRRNKRNNNYLL